MGHLLLSEPDPALLKCSSVVIIRRMTDWEATSECWDQPSPLSNQVSGDLCQSADQNPKFVRLLVRRWHIDYKDMCHVFKYSMPFRL